MTLDFAVIWRSLPFLFDGLQLSLLLTVAAMAGGITLGLVLAFEPPEPRVMDRPPRPAGTALLSRFLVWRICFVSLLFTVGVFFIFNWALWRGLGVDTARTMVVNQLVVMEIFYLFNVRYMHVRSIRAVGFKGTPMVLAAVAVVVVVLVLLLIAVQQICTDTDT